MAAQKLTKAQQGILDAIATGATLGQVPQSRTFYLRDADETSCVDTRCAFGLIDLNLIKRRPHQSGCDFTYGLTNHAVQLIAQ